MPSIYWVSGNTPNDLISLFRDADPSRVSQLLRIFPLYVKTENPRVHRRTLDRRADPTREPINQK